MQLEGKRALITGAGSGIGQRLAIEAAKRGVSLIITGRRPEALNETLAKLPGNTHHAFKADVTKAEDRTALIEAIRQHWGSLDLLVNNAGVVPVGALDQSTDEELETTVATNLVAPISLIRQALPLLQTRRHAPHRQHRVGPRRHSLPADGCVLRDEIGAAGIFDCAPPRVGAAWHRRHLCRSARHKNRGSQRARPPVDAFGMKLDAPETVATLVWDAVSRDAKTVYPAGPEKMFVLVQRLFPRLVDKSVAKQLARLAAA